MYDPSLDIHGSVISLLRRVYDQCGELPQLPGETPINLIPSSCLANSRSKMTAIFNPVYYTSRTDGSQRATLKHNLAHPFKDLPVGNRTPQIWASSPDIITSKLQAKKQHVSLTHNARLALRIASLQHEHSNTRRMSQDLRSRKPEDRCPTRTPTLSDGGSPMQPRTFSPTQSRRTSAASAIPDTPQDAIQPDRARASSVNPTASTPAISEQLIHSGISSASQIDDDMQRRSSLDNMVSQELPRLVQELTYDSVDA